MTLTEKQNDSHQTQAELHPITTKKTADMNQSFLRAARGGNLDKVLDLLKHNIDITTCNANGLNALHLACKEGHTAIVTELIKRGAKVNCTTKKGNTPLHIASLAGQLSVVELLIQDKANVNVQSFSGFTPLYMAAQENHIEVLKVLLSNGASQTLATDDGFTPLAVALQQGHDKTVTLLLENDSRGKVRLPALHIAAKKDDVKAANLLLNGEIDVDHQSASGFTPLHIAAHYGNINIATVLIERGANVNFQAKNNITPLHVSTKWGHLLMVLKLVDSNADLESRTRDGLTPLHCAARSGHAPVVDALLQAGANFSAKTRNGLSALHMAAQGDHVECGKMLIYRGANVDDTTVDYLTPIHVSAHCGNVAITQLLLEKKCEVNARALNGFTPLHIACKKNRLTVVELLLQFGALVEAATESGLTPLHVASYMGHLEIVQILLARGADPNSVTLRSETPLHLAARSNHVQIVRLLLQNNAAVDARARENQTALHIACRHGNTDMVEALLQHNASTDPPTKDNYTALHIAVKEGHQEIVKSLLDRGSKLEVTTKKGFTPLHLVAKYDRIEIAQMLLNAGSNVNAQGRNGLTPLHVATHYNSQKLINLLMDFKASPHSSAKNGYTALHIAAKKNLYNIAEILLVRGADPNAESRNGFTAIHLASQEGLVSMVTLLLRHNADVNYRAKNGLSAMHLAAQEDQVKVSEVLADAGCQIEAKTKAGYTPLHTACHFGQVNMVRYLMGHGAQANTQTEMGSTALHLAAQQGHLQLIYVLLDSGSDPNLKNTQGWTAAHVAKRQHYLNIFEILKHETNIVEIWEEIEEITTSKMELEKPETMAEHPVTDSEDDYGEPDFTTMPASPLFARPRQQTSELYRPLYDQQMSLIGVQGKLSDKHSIVSEQAQKPSGEDSIHEGVPQGEKITAIRSGREFAAAPRILDWDYTPDNVPISRKPIQQGFLVSFLVDARGGTMRGSRHLGLRVLVPPSAASAPTRVTCRMLRMERVSNPPLLNDGEGLACRVLEMGPHNCKFNSPVLLEVPHFASLREREREIMILRSENGETWKEHSLEATERAVHEAVGPDFDITESNEELREKRIVRILTTDFPYFFALVNRIRMESAMIGSDGGVISSTIVPQVQVVFPEGALQKRIRVGLQAQPITLEQVTKHLGNDVSVAVSPIVTIEPRRRKFHKPITLTIPLPKAIVKGGSGVNPNEATSLRLLCSITGGTAPAQWEDITGSTPLSRVKDCVSFTTTVSARFWLMDCRNFQESAEMAGRLYREVTVVPYMGKFAIFSKQLNPEETLLRCFCLTDDKMDKTLESQEGFELKAVSPEVEVLHDRKIWLETAGNLVPVTKMGCQLYLHFRAFRENRLPFPVRVKDLSLESVGKIAFMKEPRIAMVDGPPHQKPLSTLELRLSEEGKEELLVQGNINQPKLDSRGRPMLSEQEINTIVISQDNFARYEIYLKEVAAAVSHDWAALARELGVTQTAANQIQSDYKNDDERAYATLLSWRQETRHAGQGSELERALRRIGREDIVKACLKTISLDGCDANKQRSDLTVEGGEMDEMSADFKQDSNMLAKADTLPRTPMMSSYMTDSSAKESDNDIPTTPVKSETVQAEVDPRRSAIQDNRSEEQKRQEKEAKTAALLDLVNQLDSVSTPLPLHLQEDRDSLSGGECVQEGCSEEVDDRRPPTTKMSTEEEEKIREAKTAAFLELCNKLDSIAPELPTHLQE